MAFLCPLVHHVKTAPYGPRTPTLLVANAHVRTALASTPIRRADGVEDIQVEHRELAVQQHGEVGAVV